ncbi:MAG: HDOD domain-containing protein, partial [Bdellovibrio sp.]|nr:HDOD domain-containing protein [Bdellovibrio sp.]
MAIETDSVPRLDPEEVIAASRIPAVPDALQQILKVANQPTTTSLKLEQLVLKDPSLCAQILKMVNSSFYG